VTVPSLLILGTDAVLAAAPATPVQLVHACLAVGYQAVIPASWGDELIAARVLERLRGADAPILQCSCPLVARRLAAHGASLAPSIVAVASPPVATAKYLRALYAPIRPYVTYAGACSAADHETIDVWLAPDALASALAERGISPLTQPTEFDAVLSSDRRRFFSEPGGLPSRLALRDLPHGVTVAEPTTDDITAEVAQLLLSGSRILIDVATSQGCACSGVRRGIAAGVARATVKASEPPRALGPVVDHDLPLVLEAVVAAAPLPALESPAASPTEVGADTRKDVREPRLFGGDAEPPGITPPSRPSQSDTRRGNSLAIAPESIDASAVAVEAAGRLSPGPVRAVLGAIPQSRTDAGRQLPRAYVARRRSTPRSVRSLSANGARRSSGLTRNPMSRWLTTTAVVGAGLLAVWLLLQYIR
jgi:hypothetical protein